MYEFERNVNELQQLQNSSATSLLLRRNFLARYNVPFALAVGQMVEKVARRYRHLRRQRANPWIDEASVARGLRLVLNAGLISA